MHSAWTAKGLITGRARLTEHFINSTRNIMENSIENKMELGPEDLKNLNSTRKWTMFLSVLGFIFLGLLIIVGVATSTFLTAFKSKEVNLGVPESLMIVMFIIIAAIYFFPVLFLFRFSRNTRDAIHNHDKLKLEKAFRNLRTYFTYIGVMVIIVLSIYLQLVLAGHPCHF
jgi:amino acid transporter